MIFQWDLVSDNHLSFIVNTSTALVMVQGSEHVTPPASYTITMDLLEMHKELNRVIDINRTQDSQMLYFITLGIITWKPVYQ